LRGTAGHIPASASRAESWSYARIEILFVGAEGDMETELVPREGFEIVTVRLTNLRRSFKPEASATTSKRSKRLTSQRQAKRIIRVFAPEWP
jgi:UDP-N-acetylglucosamine--N-acetylmuramyl-(pentapeptide) pyrophosphoryl-undecaprenol N-acetylglucosamine transferase